jgi:Fe-S cluster assembly protein SufB
VRSAFRDPVGAQHQHDGIRDDDASKLIVNGFVEPVIEELPMEYAVEINRLIELLMQGSIG